MTPIDRAAQHLASWKLPDGDWVYRDGTMKWRRVTDRAMRTLGEKIENGTPLPALPGRVVPRRDWP